MATRVTKRNPARKTSKKRATPRKRTVARYAVTRTNPSRRRRKNPSMKPATKALLSIAGGAVAGIALDKVVDSQTVSGWLKHDERYKGAAELAAAAAVGYVVAKKYDPIVGAGIGAGMAAQGAVTLAEGIKEKKKADEHTKKKSLVGVRGVTARLDGVTARLAAQSYPAIAAGYPEVITSDGVYDYAEQY